MVEFDLCILIFFVIVLDFFVFVGLDFFFEYFCLFVFVDVSNFKDLCSVELWVVLLLYDGNVIDFYFVDIDIGVGCLYIMLVNGVFWCGMWVLWWRYIE